MTVSQDSLTGESHRRVSQESLTGESHRTVSQDSLAALADAGKFIVTPQHEVAEAVQFQ